MKRLNPEDNPYGICQSPLKVTNTQIKVEVIDEGIGIPQEDLPYLFKEFFRATNVGEREGTGLGLYIVKMIIETHKGKIWVESPYAKTGKGSKFAFVLPRKIKGIKDREQETREAYL